ncbi:hypothetical protein RHMOL_Rhmol13G0235000 [Rhododendron molle]|uniref:Uncharacterized protein n=1 Tax=Rhododendron molle TaxID=49168 RepID=A0ACC0LB82_RHOML|nr:hypothetical protein RHMOL_Rhmol13G0235000 [Rhododendron molle]
MMTITTTAMRTAMKKARDLERMVVHAPFLRWDKIPNPSPLSSFTVASYFLETAEGKQVIAAFAVSGSDNRMVYQPSHEFVEDYEGVFNLGCVSVDQCWYLKKLSMPGVIESNRVVWLFRRDCPVLFINTSLLMVQVLGFFCAMGTKIQATVFGTNIRILEDTLKLYQTYSISNAIVTTTPEQFRFLDQKCQLTIHGRTPVKAIKIDGLTQRSIKYNFTPLANVSQVNDPDPNVAWLNGMLAEHHRGMLCNQCLAGSGMGGSPNFAPKQLQYLLDLLTWGMALRLKGKVAVQFQSLQIL